MPSILKSAEFVNLRHQLKSFYAQGFTDRDWDVALISRFDEDDETLRPYLSTGYRPTGLPPQTLYPAQLMQSGKKGGPEFVPAKTQGGGHAEETFIRSLDELGGMFGPPRLIEVWVSRIPCGSRSSPWNAHKPFEAETMFWPPGCGPKLWVAVKATPHIRWDFYWEQGYDNLKIQSECEAHMNRIAELPNATVTQCKL